MQIEPWEHNFHNNKYSECKTERIEKKKDFTQSGAIEEFKILLLRLKRELVYLASENLANA